MYNQIGYHGTTEDNAQKIMADQHFIESKKDNEWLGSGVYFFAYKAHAKWWTKARRYKGKPTTILQASLNYTEEQLLDLDDPDTFKEVEKIVKSLVKKANTEKDKVGKLDLTGVPKDKHWCFVCNSLKKLNGKIGIIVYTFPLEVCSEITLFSKNQKQICVNDSSIIKEITECIEEVSLTPTVSNSAGEDYV